MAKPKVYKFTFYGCVHPMASISKKQLQDNVENCIWSVEDLQLVKELKVTEYKISEVKRDD